jgi:hypothetical protein
LSQYFETIIKTKADSIGAPIYNIDENNSIEEYAYYNECMYNKYMEKYINANGVDRIVSISDAVLQALNNNLNRL